MAEKGRLFTGARARFSIEGRKVGYARNVTVGEEIQYEAIEPMDNIEVEEHVPVAYRVTFSASQFRIVGETFKSLGFFPSNGANTEAHLENILVSGDLTASIEDTATGRIVMTLEQVKVQSLNYAIDARGVVGSDINFVATRLKDESEV